MAFEFSKAVDDGLKLSKRLYFGKDTSAIITPKPPPSMEKCGDRCHLPTAPMVYAVISDPGMVDNPDLPSYQPYVYGKCDPPALIPLWMNGVDLAVKSYLDTVFVTFAATWRVHCVMGSRRCDCRLVVPMGEQGSILGVEVEVPGKSYSTQLIKHGTNKDPDKGVEYGAFLTPQIFTLTIPEIDGGSNLSVKLNWSQKLLYRDGHFTLNIPYTFPDYVTPVVKKIPKRQKIHLDVSADMGTEVFCKTLSHPLKEVRRQLEKLDLFYESDVLTWSKTDLRMSYTVSSDDVLGGVILQSAALHDFDQREMFCAYLFLGNEKTWKVFRKDVVFVVDISGSMVGRVLEDTKNALYEALSKLDPRDSFNIIAFNSESYLFSISMVLAAKEAVERAVEWIGLNFIPKEGTNILPSLSKAVDMLSKPNGSLPIIILVTDGAVEDERHICEVMKNHITNQESISPRVYTFGIGPYCNHYFLQMLALIGRGHYDSTFELDTVESRMQNLFTRASSTILANITIGPLDDLDGLEVYPSCIPDIAYESPLMIFGRYSGSFPENLKANGILADLNSFEVDLRIQKSKDIPLERVAAKQQIDLLTTQAWYSKDEHLEEKVEQISMQSGVLSEFTRMFLIEIHKGKTLATQPRKTSKKIEAKVVEPESHKMILLQRLSIGFGNLTATAENIPLGTSESKLPEAAEIIVKAASNCCSKMFGYCCCMCCIQCCSKINNQFAIALTQICTTMAFVGCFECCSEVCMCCNGDDVGRA